MFDRRVYRRENLCSATQKDFCDSIGQKADVGVFSSDVRFASVNRRRQPSQAARER
jgi:hypothetical protein